jgi:hypothetical protein
MADISVTAANVIPSSSASIQTGTAGATIVAGQTVYIDTGASNVLKLSYNAGTLLEGTVCGIALNGGASGQVIRYVTEDPALVLGATMTVGDAVYLGGVAGGMTITTVDLDTGEYCSILGICTVVNSTISMKIIRAGAARTTNQV